MATAPAAEPDDGEGDIFAVSPEQSRKELIDDLRQGGYVHRDAPGEDGWYFDKHLVLSRPALLARAGRLLAGLLPEGVERLVVTDVVPSALGASIARDTGISLLFGTEADDGLAFHGEPWPNVKVVLVEDVVLTGTRALMAAQVLTRLGADVVCVLCLLDRESGGAERLREAGHSLRALFTERELQASPARVPF
jgi:orotate phosphoribosyltransferase